jgi:hypothetical protein
MVNEKGAIQRACGYHVALCKMSSPSASAPLSRFKSCSALPVVFLLLKQLSSKLETDAEVILTTLLIKLIIGETDAGESPSGKPEKYLDGLNATYVA